MSDQDHVAGPICDDCIRVSGSIIQEMFYLLHCALCWVRLLCGNRSERWEHGEVHGSRIVQESAGDFLDELLVGLAEEGRIV